MLIAWPEALIEGLELSGLLLRVGGLSCRAFGYSNEP
jgi:hypothetical protein